MTLNPFWDRKQVVWFQYNGEIGASDSDPFHAFTIEGGSNDYPPTYTIYEYVTYFGVDHGFPLDDYWEYYMDTSDGFLDDVVNGLIYTNGARHRLHRKIEVNVDGFAPIIIDDRYRQYRDKRYVLAKTPITVSLPNITEAVRVDITPYYRKLDPAWAITPFPDPPTYPPEANTITDTSVLPAYIQQFILMPGEEKEIKFEIPGVWYMRLHSPLSGYVPGDPHYMTPGVAMPIHVLPNAKSDLMRSSLYLPNPGNNEAYRLEKDTVVREINRLKNELMYAEAEESLKLTHHHDRCLPVSDSGSRATYLYTLTRIVEAAICALSYYEAGSIFPAQNVDITLVKACSLALDVIWVRTFRLEEIYDVGLLDHVVTSINYTEILTNPDDTVTTCIPDVALIEADVLRWVNNIKHADNANRLLPSIMDVEEIAHELRLMFYEGALAHLPQTVLTYDGVPLTYDGLYGTYADVTVPSQ